MLRGEDIYEDILRDHILHSDNKMNSIESINQSAEGTNHVCGDNIKVNICNKHNVIQEISFTGNCCSTAKLSAILMTEELTGKTTDEAEELFKKVITIITSEDNNNYHYDGLLPILIKQLSVISAGKQLRQTTKCVLLPWKTMLDTLHSKKVKFTITEKDYSLYLY